MTSLIVMLPLIVVVEISLQLHRSSCQMMEWDPCKQLGWLLWMTPSRLFVCGPHSAQCKWVMRTTRPLASYPCWNANLAHVLWPFAKLPGCGVNARLDLKHWAKLFVLVTKQKPGLLHSLPIVTSTWCGNFQIPDSIYRGSVYSVLIVHVTIVLLLVLKSMIQVSGFSCLFLNDLHSNIVPDHVLLSLWLLWVFIGFAYMDCMMQIGGHEWQH
jgi:hypothetical protein